MKYKIAVQETEEGFSVSVPGLPGCCSKGQQNKKRWRISRMRSGSISLLVMNYSRVR